MAQPSTTAPPRPVDTGAAPPAGRVATDTAPAPAPAEGTPSWLRWTSWLTLAIPIGGLAISFALQWGDRAPGQTWQEVLYANSLGWLVGAFLCITAPPHLFFPAPIARSIGWAPSPFQWELGVACVGLAIAGIMAGGQPRPFALATIIVFTTFLWGCAIGHVRSAIRDRNFSVNNVGPIFFYDVLGPALLIYLYAATA